MRRRSRMRSQHGASGIEHAFDVDTARRFEAIKATRGYDRRQLMATAQF